jgi:hypothetical protein
MRPSIRIAVLALLLIAGSFSGFSQLRNFSDYKQDRINRDQTRFTLKENNTAEFSWASEWTHTTANDYSEKCAIFVWHFKNGTKAYSLQGESIDEAGRTTGYLLTKKSSALEDKSHNKIQPMTRENYPVKVELWLGKNEDPAGLEPEMPVDRVCFDAQSIEYNRANTFSDCRESAGILYK